MRDFIKKLDKKYDMGILVKLLLVLLDVISINLSSFLAIWIRFGLEVSEIEPKIVQSVIGSVVINTAATVLLFALFHLYTSLWRFASIKELAYVLEGCVCSGIGESIYNIFG